MIQKRLKTTILIQSKIGKITQYIRNTINLKKDIQDFDRNNQESKQYRQEVIKERRRKPMNYQLEQALLDEDSRQFLFKLEDKIIKYLEDMKKVENNEVEGIQFFNLKSYQKALITKILDYYKFTSKVIYIKVSVNKNKPNQEKSSNPKQQNEQEGEDNSNQVKRKKKQGLLIFRNNENVKSPIPTLKLRDYFTSHQLQIHQEIIDSKQQFKKKKKFAKKIQFESEDFNENSSSSIGKDEDCSLSSASSNTGILSKDESQNSSRQKIDVQEDNPTAEKSNNFLPNLTHILCIIESKETQSDEQFNLYNWINALGFWKYTIRRQSQHFSYIVFENENDAQQMEQMEKIANKYAETNNLGLKVIPLIKIDRKQYREELKNEYLDQTIQKPKASVEVANRIIFGILGDRKEIKNNSGDIMRRLVNKD